MLILDLVMRKFDVVRRPGLGYAGIRVVRTGVRIESGAAYLLRHRNENGDIAGNPAAMVRRAVAGCRSALDCHGNVIKPSFRPTRPRSQGWARGGVAASLHRPRVGAPMVGRSRPR